MDPITHEEMAWLLSAVGTVAIIISSIWWRIEHRQDKKIDQLHEENHNAHLLLHKKVDDLQEQQHENQLHIMAKFEELWRNIQNGSGK